MMTWREGEKLFISNCRSRYKHDKILCRSLVDLNRAGVPLMELVFEPDLEDGEEAAALVKELVLIMNRLGTCSCKMEGKEYF